MGKMMHFYNNKQLINKYNQLNVIIYSKCGPSVVLKLEINIDAKFPEKIVRKLLDSYEFCKFPIIKYFDPPTYSFHSCFYFVLFSNYTQVAREFACVKIT